MPKATILEDGIDAAQFDRVLSAKRSSRTAYPKFAYYKPLGYPEGSYRVGPLARLNIVKSMGTPLADEELEEFKQAVARGRCWARSTITTRG